MRARLIRQVSATLLLILILAGCVLSSRHVPFSDAELIVKFVDVEQGSCALVVSPSGAAALIDAGTSSAKTNGDPVKVLLETAQEIPGFWLKYIVATHCHTDHISRICAVIRDIRIKRPALLRGREVIVLSQSRCPSLVDLGPIPSKAVRPTPPDDTIDLGGGVLLTCYAADGWYRAPGEPGKVSIPADGDKAEDRRSIALLLTYKNFSAWFGGDLDAVIEKALVKACSLPDVDVDVVHHHGSNESSSCAFLNALRPEVAICQSGQKNTYGHPDREAVNRILSVLPPDGKFIQQNGNPDNRTSCDPRVVIADPDGEDGCPGTITLTTDGHDLTVCWPGDSVVLSTASRKARPAAAGASPSATVCINEVELNPEGEDVGNEWVELYNPADEPVNLNRWEIRATCGQSASVWIPMGTVIEAKSYLVFENSGRWLENEGEVVELWNGNALVDTTELSDTEDDNCSWSRLPDGGPHWVFQPSTREKSNG